MDKFERTRHDLEELKDINQRLLDGSYIKHLSSKLSETESEFKAFCQRVREQFRKCHTDLEDAERHFSVDEDEKEKLNKFHNRQCDNGTEANDLKSQLMELSNFPVLDWNKNFTALLGENDVVKLHILNPRSDASPIKFESSRQQKYTTSTGRRVSKQLSLPTLRRKSNDYEICLPNTVVNDENNSCDDEEFIATWRSGLKKNSSDIKLKSNTETETQTAESSFDNNKQDNSTCTDNQYLIDGQTQTTSRYDDLYITDITANDERVSESEDKNDDGIHYDGSDNEADQVGGRKLNDRREHKRRPKLKRTLTMDQLTTSTDYKHSYIEEAVAPFSELIHRLSTVHTSDNQTKSSVTQNDAMSGTGNQIIKGTDEVVSTRSSDQLSETIQNSSDLIVSQGETKPTDVPIVVPNIEIFEDGSVKVASWTDLALFENYVVLATDEGLLKIKRNECGIFEKLPMKSILAICEIKDSMDIGVLIHQNGIAVVSTDQMVVKYKLNTKKSYSKICHLSTFTGGRPDPSYQFALIISTETCTSVSGRLHADNVVFVHAQPDKFDVLLPTPKYSAYFQKPIFALKDSESINCIGSFGSESVVLCTPMRVVCFEIDKTSTKPLWEIKLRKNATDIVCTKLKVYVCVKDEGKIIMVNKHGRIEKDNILESNCAAKPDKISVHGDTIMMKEFQESKWANTMNYL